MAVFANHTTKSWGFRALVGTQFLTSFNDSAYRVSIVLLAHRANAWSVESSTVASLAMVLFLLPYALFSLAAGRTVDRYSKRGVFIVWKLVEVGIIALGLAGLTHADTGESWALVLMLAMLFCLGMQSTFLSPTRYGILPEILSDEELSHGNGNLELGNYLGFMAGTFAAGVIVDGILPPGDYWWATAFIPLATILGILCSFAIPHVPAANPQQSLAEGINPLAVVRLFRRNWQVLCEHRGLVPTVWGLTIFWGISILYLLNTPHFGREVLGLAESSIDNNWLLIATSVGVGVGSWLAGRISRGTIELGLVPIGSGLWFIAAVGMVFAHGFVSSSILLALAGIAAGLYAVPLIAFLEKFSPAADRASCIATANVVSVAAMIAACAWNYLLVSVFGLGAKAVFFSAGIILLAATYWIFRMLPDFFVRLMVMLLMKSFYRIQLVGAENVPQNGPALLVLNHSSFVDGNLLVASFHRFIRFVVYQGHYEVRILRWLGEVMQAIPIDSEAPPKKIVQALRQASEVLQRGELLCIFAEGQLTRTGFLLPFQRGFEQILKRASGVPIIPGYIDGMWGSIFSFHRGKFFWKVPKQLRYPVRIKFGKPMPSDSTAGQVREQVQVLAAECFALRKAERVTLCQQFVRNARRHPRRTCIADPNTPMLNFGQALMRSVVLTRLLRRRLGPEQYVGVLLPPSVGGVLANVAISNLSKTPVNLNYTVGNDVLNGCVRHAGLKTVVTSKAFLEKVPLKPDAEILFLEDLRGDLQTSDKLTGLAARILPARVTERFILGLGRVGMDDLATIIFSSGSTGIPKGVMLTQYNIVANIESTVQMIDATEHDRLLGVLPFFHSFGYTVTLWLPLVIMASAVYHFNPLDAETIGKLARDYRVSIFLSTATFLRNYIRRCDPDDFRSLRLLVCGAEKLPMQVAEQFEKRFGVRPLEGYGCTELSPVVSTNRPDFVQGSFRQVGHKPGTIGHPVPGVAVRVVDAESRRTVPIGSEGLLLVKGPNVMKGYLDRPDLSAEAIVDGWYVTGDVAKLDEDGFITITDRMSRFSKIGGEMVPHYKIEEIVHRILDTHEQLCVVVGIPDERKGERLVVIHKPLPVDIDTLWERLRADGIPPLWLPAKNAFFEVSELPVLGSGKLDLKGIKALAHEKAKAHWR